MNPIRVAVHGALGKVGSVLVDALSQETEIALVGAVDFKAKEDYLRKPDGSGAVPLSNSLDCILSNCQPDVLVDFTVAQASLPAIRLAVSQGVNLVIGTTGFSSDDICEIEQLALKAGVGVVVAPNFSLGAVVMMHLARLAGKYFDTAEIIELHHDQKVDAPSGTARSTASMMAETKGKPFTLPEQARDAKSRGEQLEGISIHSVRLPGLLAHQEVILGGPGQTLRIRHDTIGRECYTPGVILAIKKVIDLKGLVYGLDILLGLRDRE